MTNKEAVNWLINITADIGKREHRDLWHYEQALSEIKQMLEEADHIPDTTQMVCEDKRYLLWKESYEELNRRMEGLTLCEDAVSRQAAIDALHMHLMYRMGTDSNKKRLDDWINGVPSAQPERKRGHWLINSDGYYPYCSECRKEPKSGDMTDFCPYCGADMKGGKT